MREIGEAVGLTSSSSVHSQLENLQRKGYLTKDPTKPRAIGEPGVDRGVQVPLVGRIAAGSPTMAEQQVESMLAVPSEFTGRTGEHFALRVAGNSMTGAGIDDGDVVLIRQQDDCDDGDIVAVIAAGPGQDEATVKRLRRENGRVVLIPENPRLEPFELGEGGRVLGKVVAVLHKL